MLAEGLSAEWKAELTAAVQERCRCARGEWHCGYATVLGAAQGTQRFVEQWHSDAPAHLAGISVLIALHATVGTDAAHFLDAATEATGAAAATAYPLRPGDALAFPSALTHAGGATWEGDRLIAFLWFGGRATRYDPTKVRYLLGGTMAPCGSPRAQQSRVPLHYDFRLLPPKGAEWPGAPEAHRAHPFGYRVRVGSVVRLWGHPHPLEAIGWTHTSSRRRGDGDGEERWLSAVCKGCGTLHTQDIDEVTAVDDAAPVPSEAAAHMWAEIGRKAYSVGGRAEPCPCVAPHPGSLCRGAPPARREAGADAGAAGAAARQRG
jgi:hypothetical protein